MFIGHRPKIVHSIGTKINPIYTIGNHYPSINPKPIFNSLKPTYEEMRSVLERRKHN
jgi:hypothetical protein